MKTNYINKKNPVQKAKIYEDSTHLYKFYSFKFIEFKSEFFKFEGPQSLETIQRRYNYNNNSFHHIVKVVQHRKMSTEFITNVHQELVFNIAYIMTKNEPMDYDQRVLITTRTMDNLKKKELVNSEETTHKANEYIASYISTYIKVSVLDVKIKMRKMIPNWPDNSFHKFQL